MADASTRATHCCFCETPLVVEVGEGEPGRRNPDFVIPFSLPPEEAEERFRRWIRESGWLYPEDLAASYVPEPALGLYLPFWCFQFLAESHWKASIGEHWWRTEEYQHTTPEGKTETRTRSVRETEWFPLTGKHQQDYPAHTVSASKGLPDPQDRPLGAFRLEGAKPYRSAYLAGWASEECSLDPEPASRLARLRILAEERAQVAAMLPGDTYWWLRVRTELQEKGRFLLLAPVYLVSYHYRGRSYRYLLNGQTGVQTGTRPWAWGRLVRLLLLGLVIGVAAWFWAAGRPA